MVRGGLVWLMGLERVWEAGCPRRAVPAGTGCARHAALLRALLGWLRRGAGCGTRVPPHVLDSRSSRDLAHER